jgi:hypothetical protein
MKRDTWKTVQIEHNVCMELVKTVENVHISRSLTYTNSPGQQYDMGLVTTVAVVEGYKTAFQYPHAIVLSL